MQKKRKRLSKPKFQVNLRKEIPKTKESHVELTFWLALTVLLVCNFTISVVLIPFLMVLKRGALDLILILFGLMFGSLFKLTLSSIDGLKEKHHTLATFFVPSIAIVNIAVITTITNQIDFLLKLNIEHDPAILGGIYAIAFLMPFAYHSIKNKLKEFF